MSNNKILVSGEVNEVTPNLGRRTLVYTIKMEQVTVSFCTVSMGCDNILLTRVSLQATSI